MTGKSVQKRRVPDFVVIGQVRRPHGVRGTLRVAPLTEDPQRFLHLETVYLNLKDDQRTLFTIDRVQVANDAILISLKEIESRETADLWRAAWVEIPGDQIMPIEDGQHYLFEIVGLQVHSEEGEPLGEVIDILRNPAHDVYVVRNNEREFMVPAVPEFIRQIDSESGIMIIHLVDGLLDL
jgi:16S rRNA processing protein RimM